MRTEHLRAERAPRDGVRVVRLRVLAGPQAGAGDGEERLALGVDDGEHHDVVENRTDDGAEHLHAERHAGRELAVLAELEVLEERDTLLQRVRAVHRAVDVRDRPPRHHVRGDHLEEAVARCRELGEPDRRRERRVERAEDEADDEQDRERPPWQTGVARVVRRLRDAVCAEEDGQVPPTRDLLVRLHLLPVRVVDEVLRLVPRVEGEDERLEVVPVEEGDVRDESAQRKVGRDQVERVRRREVGRAQFLVLGVIESAVREQCRLVVYRPVLREDVLAHEGEVLRLPDVAVVHRRHENVRQADTDVLVKLEPEGRPEARRPDEVPVEAERKETHALVVGGAAEHVPYNGRVVVRKTED